jgi:hypothetical protein
MSAFGLHFLQDIKPDNIMVAASYSDEEIGDILDKEPPRYYPTMKILGREFHPVVSQPLPSPQLSTEKLVFKLADFGHGGNICGVTNRFFAYNYFQLNGSRERSRIRSHP